VYFSQMGRSTRMSSGESGGWIAYGWGWLTTIRRRTSRRTTPSDSCDVAGFLPRSSMRDTIPKPVGLGSRGGGDRTAVKCFLSDCQVTIKYLSSPGPRSLKIRTRLRAKHSSMPNKPPRSRREPPHECIKELRGRGRRIGASSRYLRKNMPWCRVYAIKR
jgi:hypothetical protein